MSLIGEKVLLRIYLQSADRSPHTPTFERIIKAARQEGLAGATVLKGILGDGYHGPIKPKAFSLVEHAPIIVEIVDDGEQISRFVRGKLDELMIGGMLTLERAAVMMYRPRQATANSSGDAMKLARSCEPLSTLPEVPMGPHMKLNENGVLLRVFIGESDRFEHKPLYEAIVQKSRELGLAGATVLRGAEGFGANSVVHKSALLEMSTDLPIVIEIVDTEQSVQKLLPHLEAMVKEGMVTMEYVAILIYRHDPADAPTV